MPISCDGQTGKEHWKSYSARHRYSSRVSLVVTSAARAAAHAAAARTDAMVADKKDLANVDAENFGSEMLDSFKIDISHQEMERIIVEARRVRRSFVRSDRSSSRPPSNVLLVRPRAVPSRPLTSRPPPPPPAARAHLPDAAGEVASHARA
jgi:hypothetical protein